MWRLRDRLCLLRSGHSGRCATCFLSRALRLPWRCSELSPEMRGQSLLFPRGLRVLLASRDATCHLCMYTRHPVPCLGAASSFVALATFETGSHRASLGGLLPLGGLLLRGPDLLGVTGVLPVPTAALPCGSERHHSR